MSSPQTAGQDVVSVFGLSKAYGGVQALTDMNLSVARGSVHAVIGENGAGKSTLMKILAGAVRPDNGEIRIDGQLADLKTPAAASSLGVGIVYQELTVFPERSILANLFVSKQPRRKGLVDKRAMEKTARPVLDRMGLNVPTSTPIAVLGVGEQQLVELTRLLIRRPQVLILDEPNSALNERETQRLFEVLRELTAGGITIIYVSHRLEEVFQIADRITVMRNGGLVWTKDLSDTSIPEVVDAMVGIGTTDLFPPRQTVPSGMNIAKSLVVKGLCIGDEIRDVSFEVRPGEVVGLGGLEGSGTASVLGALFGTREATSGTVDYPNHSGLMRSATEAARNGVSLVPADRKGQGLMLDRSIEWNVNQVTIGTLKRRWWISKKEMRAAVDRQIKGMSIKTQDPGGSVGRLSGGNQQKVVIGKWLEASPRIFLLDDLTRGVDVGAKAEIYKLIRQLSDGGAIVLFRSSELPELVGLADRILVMYRGKMVGEIPGTAVSDESLLHAINTGIV